MYPCREYEQVSLPIAAILGRRGQLDIYPEVAGHGLFDIDYRRGQLVLRAKGHVGLIPISDRIAIHVQPRAPLGNLLYMIWRAGYRPGGLEGFLRGYRATPGTLDGPEALYVHAFVSALKAILGSGPLKRFLELDTETDARGRMLLSKTVSRFRARGIAHRHVFRQNVLTTDNLENRIVKHTSLRLLKHFVCHESGLKLARSIARFLEPLTTVDADALTPEFVARRAPASIRSLPNSHLFYASALWLAYLIATRSGVSMEHLGSASFETLVINVSQVFERYVRQLCEEAAASAHAACTVYDGNLRPVPLFSGGQYLTQPDFYFARNGNYIAVADAKYKPKVSTEDRYELLAFCQALGVKKAAFLCPCLPDQQLVNHQGTTRAGHEVYVVRIDLAARDMAAEEQRFKAALSATLRLPP